MTADADRIERYRAYRGPSTLELLARGHEERALRDGVCPKIVDGSNLQRLHACRKPLAEGSRWCKWHLYGV